MTSEEKKKFERQTEIYSISYKYEAPKEKAVKINVKTVKPIHEESNEKPVVIKIVDSQPESEI